MPNAEISSAGRPPDPGWRRLALWLLIFGQGGVLLELWLLEHYEDVWQWTPLALLAGGLMTSLWFARWPGPRSLRILSWLMRRQVAQLSGQVTNLARDYRTLAETLLGRWT